MQMVMFYAIVEPRLHHYEYYQVAAQNKQGAKQRLFDLFDREVEETRRTFEGLKDQEQMVWRAKELAATKKINVDLYTNRIDGQTYDHVI